MITLWDFQKEVIEASRDAISRGYRSLLIVAPTGSGKTVIGASMIQSADEKHKQSMFMAHRRELIKQTAKKLWDFGVTHGIIMAGEPMSEWEGVQIASIDTLRARYMNPKKNNQPELPKIAILMIDEAHRTLSPTYLKLIRHYQKQGTIIIGLTATPIRGDGKGLGHVFDCMIQAPSMMELIELGFLVQPRYFVPSIPDLTGVKIVRGDYVEKQLAKVMDHRELVGDVVSHWLRIAPDRKTIVYASGVKHSIHIAQRFKESGVRAAHIDGNTPLDERADILADLAEGDLQVVSNCMVLTEGYDCPIVSCAVLARPTRHLGLYIQMGGRPLRTFSDKDDAIIIDHAGNLYEHGYLEDDHGWALTEGAACTDLLERQKDLDEKNPITCSECAYVYTGQLICPMCGHKPEIRGESPVHRQGELMEVRRLARETAAEQAIKKQPVTHEQKQEWYSMFYQYAQAKGHKEGSVAHKYKEKFGVWPVNMEKIGVSPTPECLSYITSLNIRHAYRKKKAA